VEERDRAIKSAHRVLTWTKPLKILGWIIVAVAVLAVIAGIAAVIGGANSGLTNGAAIGGATLLGSLIGAFFILVNAALVLVVTYYAEMRAHDTIFQATIAQLPPTTTVS
jgi:uncharacterized membrane protein